MEKIYLSNTESREQNKYLSIVRIGTNLANDSIKFRIL